MSASDPIASPDSILGQLQRGRGEGYRRLLTVPRADAYPLLLQCITSDPRLDSQVESRDSFYASLAFEIRMPLEPLADYLRQHDDPSQFSAKTTLTVTTLTELAKRDYRNSREILCDYISWGRWWDWPLDDLLDLSDPNLSSRIAREIERHFPTEATLEEGMSWLRMDTLTKLSSLSPRIDALISKAQEKSPHISRATVPKLAQKLPPRHVTLEDVPSLRSELRLMLADEEKEWDCFSIKDFFHLPDIGLIPELVEIFYRFRFSTGRKYAAQAIQITSPDFFRDTLALECLWDCEAETRALAAKAVSLESHEAQYRLNHLADDQMRKSATKLEVDCYLPRSVKQRPN